eukprot:355417_1
MLTDEITECKQQLARKNSEMKLQSILSNNAQEAIKKKLSELTELMKIKIAEKQQKISKLIDKIQAREHEHNINIQSYDKHSISTETVEYNKRISKESSSDLKSVRRSIKKKARKSVLIAHSNHLKNVNRKYKAFINKLCDILQYEDKENLVNIMNICRNRLTMSPNSYLYLYEIMSKTCNFLLDIINNRSLNLNKLTNSLSKFTMKYDV